MSLWAENPYVQSFHSSQSREELVLSYFKHHFKKDIIPDSTEVFPDSMKNAFFMCNLDMVKFIRQLELCTKKQTDPGLSDHLVTVVSACREMNTRFPVSILIPMLVSGVSDSSRLEATCALHKRLAVYHPGTTDCLLAAMEYILCADVYPVEHLVRKIISQYRLLLETGFPPGLESMFCAELAVYMHHESLKPDLCNCRQILDTVSLDCGVSAKVVFPMVLAASMLHLDNEVFGQIRQYFLNSGSPNPPVVSWLFGLTACFLDNCDQISSGVWQDRGLLSSVLVWFFASLFPARMRAQL